MKNKTETKPSFVIILNEYEWETPRYSDEISNDPRDCYDDEALFGGVDIDVLLDRAKQKEEKSHG